MSQANDQPIDLLAMAKKAKAAAPLLATAPTATKNGALSALINLLKNEQQTIIKANQRDIDEAKAAALSESMIDRLSLQGGLTGIIAEIEQVIALKDPI